MKKLIILLVAFCIQCGTAFALDQVCYVQSVKAKVMAEPSFSAKVIAEVGKGYKFLSPAKTGNWYKVSYSGKTGYVSALLVSTHPPLQKTTVIRADEAELNQGVRRRASTYTSAAAARGLTADDRRRLGAEEKADYTSVDKMEALVVTDDDVQKFRQGGGL